MKKVTPPLVLVALAAVLISACSTTNGAQTVSGQSSTTVTSTPPSTTPVTTAAAVTTTTTPPPPTTTTTSLPPLSSQKLTPGSTGPAVLALQKRLVLLGYWLGTPDGNYGDATQQAVYALQKAAGISRDGIFGPNTEEALAKGTVPKPRKTPGYVIEVDLEDDLIMFVDNGKLEYTLNTSTGGGYTYKVGKQTAVAITPVGYFHMYREVDGMVTDSLGQLWRPKFFDSGFAIHGDSYVPPVPVSHGCVRVSNEAIDWIWANSLAPIGTAVWVY